MQIINSTTVDTDDTHEKWDDRSLDIASDRKLGF